MNIDILEKEFKVQEMDEETKLSFEIWLDGIERSRYEWFCNMTKKYLAQSKFKEAIMNLDNKNSIIFNATGEEMYHVIVNRKELRVGERPIIHTLELDLTKAIINKMIQDSTLYRIESKLQVFTEKACYPLTQW